MKMIAEIIKQFRKRSIGSIKITLFTLLIGGLLIDLSFSVNKSEETVTIEQGTTSNNIALFFIGLFVFLVIVDIWDWKLRHSQKSALISKIDSENLDAPTKQKLIELLEKI